MAEEKKKEEGEEAAPPVEAPKKSKKLFLIIGAVVLLAIAAGVPLFLMTRKSAEPETELNADAAALAEHEEGAAEEDEYIEGEEPLGVIFPLETFVVNLNGGKFIRLQAQLEFARQDVSPRFYARIVPIRDRIISMLSSKSQEDLASATDKEKLKEAIKDAINEMLKREEIKKVYFSQFIVQ